MKYMKVRTMNGPRLLFFCVFIILGCKKEFCYNILSSVDIVPFSLIAFTICRYNSTNSSAAFSSVLWKGDSERKSIGELLAIICCCQPWLCNLKFSSVIISLIFQVMTISSKKIRLASKICTVTDHLDQIWHDIYGKFGCTVKT